MKKIVSIVGMMLVLLLVVSPITSWAGEDLWYAAKNGNTSYIREDLAAGNDVNQGDSHGNTPLFWAAYNGHTDVVKLLLAHGADVNQANKGGATPLWAAAAFDHIDI